MASLYPGALSKLLEDMDSGLDTAGKHRSAMLQVISIIPAIAGSDFWPNQGFYLKVSDSSHATYVSLPHEEDEMILGDKLQLGQFIHVDNLERGFPVPILRGAKPIPGRHPCIGCPKDIVSRTNLLGARAPLPKQASCKEKSDHAVKEALEKPCQLSASKTSPSAQVRRKVLNLSLIPTPPFNLFPKHDAEKNNSDILKELENISITCTDQDSDSDNSRSSCHLRQKGLRRSWDGKGSGVARLIERSNSRAAVKHENQPLARTQSADHGQIAHSQFAQNDDIVSKDDHSLFTSARKRELEPSTKRKTKVISKTHAERSYGLEPLNLPNSTYHDRKWIEDNVSWASLPSILVNLGKEVLKQRDVAVFAAVEALQEAAAAERLIRCLRIYSELQSIKDDNARPMVDRFLNLHHDMIQARVITQSLAQNPVRTSDRNSLTPYPIKETVEVASERKKHAASWIKAAVAADLSPFLPATKSKSSKKAATAKRRICSVNCSSKPRGHCIINKQRKNDEIQLVQAAAEESLEWMKGSGLLVAVDLADALQGECKRWFLDYVEKYLDDLGSKTNDTSSERQIAGVLCQIKRVENWLGVITHNDCNQSKDGCTLLDDEETQACGRVRKKIYSILLKHVESAAHALENMNIAASEDW